ncbi:hypothetical protein [Lentzea sp. NEAU-D7]|uniref:hypothetical protein n=1 Tax=Lentzea sp. NEAU-D7 TaxID=2994667 RepID=UPI00224AC620|nr:hypothetical protein [Lentzea sp. NEAU-D7]MCX2948948.1 hypothetical protein [Lentzea sp. NEAU-D7]
MTSFVIKVKPGVSPAFERDAGLAAIDESLLRQQVPRLSHVFAVCESQRHAEDRIHVPAHVQTRSGLDQVLDVLGDRQNPSPLEVLLGAGVFFSVICGTSAPENRSS